MLSQATACRVEAIVPTPGAADAVQETFERCAQAFCRFFTVRLGGNEHAVDDLMQRLWVKARVKAGGLRGANPEPWLWRIAQNLLREQRRVDRGPRGRIILADPVLARELAQRFDTQELPDELLARCEVREQLLLALTALPADEQELLIGFYFDGRGQRELAATLGSSERAVEGRLYRARAMLRDRLAHLEP